MYYAVLKVNETSSDRNELQPVHLFKQVDTK